MSTVSKFVVSLALAAAACSVFAAQYRVTVDGRPVEVIEIPAPSMHDWQLPDEAVRPYFAALFDAGGEVVVRVESDADVSRTRILPLSRGVVPRIEGPHALTFAAKPPFTLSVEPEPRHGALVVSARVPEANPPREGDPGVKWIGPGRRHFDKPIELGSGETLYLAPGAFVEAAVRGTGTNITVCGHGVLSGLCWQWKKGPANHMMHFEGANITLRDFTVMGSYHWTVVMNNVDGARIESLNILNGHVLNDDGIDVCRSRGVTISDCFIRTQDDCIAPKYWVEGLKVENCTLWADVANIFRIGYECDGPQWRFSGVRIGGTDVIHQAVSNSKGWNKAVSIQASNDEVFEDFVIDGLRFDSPKADDMFACVQTVVIRDEWQQHEKAGHIRDVKFRNVGFRGDEPSGGACTVVVRSHDAEHKVGEVTVEDSDPRIRVDFGK